MHVKDVFPNLLDLLPPISVANQVSETSEGRIKAEAAALMYVS